MLSKNEAQGKALLQNASLAVFKSVDTQIQAAADTGAFSVEITLTEDELTDSANLENDLKVRGFTVEVSGDDNEIYTISFGA